MATWLGHGIAGVTVAKAMGFGPRAQALAFALANAPDLDQLVGLAAEGDASALHRAWWSHSPIVALYGVVAVFIGYALLQALRRPVDRRQRGRYAAFAALVLLTHTITDFVLINPTVLVPRPDGLPQAAGRELLALFTDVLFYGLIVLALYQLYLRLRQRLASVACLNPSHWGRRRP